MPVSYQIDRERGTIHTRCYGNVRFEEVVDHFRVLQQDPDCPQRLDVLLDLTECSSVPETNQLRTVGTMMGQVDGRIQFGACAIVASSDLIYGMARMFQVFAENRFRVTRAFRNLDEGKMWLLSASPE